MCSEYRFNVPIDYFTKHARVNLTLFHLNCYLLWSGLFEATKRVIASNPRARSLATTGGQSHVQYIS